ncbi:hypothetical protein SPRG_17620 [Saprolegnia parasitica CBS 223.65]|uniref:Uncharacterized protein n=1 Tax=Saprolegnia parasitica (strain CBS 223.65) TaxID=695850 RepID=A0A067BFJ6_SAPPC|nr:hypothetical protein SPRG_17620 [Saprolegnia parasitica CBS 223.65]KDO16918.1 hypothetical protein SPRG_17620 [Saprolegnia parasitica CBS 223.65]|eukprot:XP_012212375.1 hypothetical protein SPRG_17620 [Saprolegnia parasitica CBS 223.65]
MRPRQPLLAIDPQARRHDGTNAGRLLLRDLFIWPFQWLTYATLLYSSAYVLLTLVAYLAAVLVVLLAACLVPYAVLSSLLSLFTQQSAPYWYPWRVLYACTRPLLIADVWLHNQFARRSQCIAGTYDLSRRHYSSCEDHPRFVVRMIEVDSPSALLMTWAYLLIARSVVGVMLGGLYVAAVANAMDDSISIVLAAVKWQWTSMCYFIIWGPNMSCDEHAVGCAGGFLLAMLTAVAPRSLVMTSFGRMTRFFSSETVLVLSDT